MFKLSKDLLTQKYRINKLNSYQIAKKYHYSATWINKLRKKYKIATIKHYQKNKQQKLTLRQKAYIYGSLLGDGCIKVNKKHIKGNAYLSIGQTNKQYLQFQHSLMKSFINSPLFTRIDKRINRSKCYYLRTMSHPVFTNIYKHIYPKGRKTISKQWLQELTPLSLAIWYMDDGSLTKSTHQMRISTESFNYQENQIIAKFLLHKWGIKPEIIKSNAKGKFLLKFTSLERNKFFSLVDKFIISTMRYKLYDNYENRSKVYWVESEIADLQENYFGSRINWDKMTTMLNRSKQAITKKASLLKLTNRR